MEGASGSVVLMVVGGLDLCLLSFLVLFNLVSLVRVLRGGEDKPSGLAWGAWALSGISLLLGPCAWLGLLVALVMASFEQRRSYQGNSTLASIGLCRLARVNVGVQFALYVVTVAVALFTSFAG